MRPVIIDRAPAALVANGICLSQTPGAGSGSLTLNGSLVSSTFPNVGVAVLDIGRQVKLDPGAGNLTGMSITFNGTDEGGRAVSETVAGANGAPSLTTTMFKTITSITYTGSPGGVAIVVGTSGVAATLPIVIDQYISPVNFSMACEVSGTINFTGQYTYDDVFTLAPSAINWINIAALTSKAANTDTALTAPVKAVRTLINSFTAPGSVRTIVLQAGGHGMA